MGPRPTDEGVNVWEAHAARPKPEVTDTDVLAYMRAQLAEKQVKAALLSAEIKTLTAGIAYLEGGGSIKDIPATRTLPAPALSTE